MLNYFNNFEFLHPNLLSNEMKNTILIISILVFSLSISAQDTGQKTFAVAVKENIKKYNTACNSAYEKGDMEKAQFLFDTLVNNRLVGTKFEDYTLRRANGGKLKLSSIKKPVLLQTYTSWCVLNKGEIPALNKLAKKYAKDLKIVIVFWDKKQSMKAIANQFSSNIEVCYANENNYKDGEVVAVLKYAIGYLSSYYLDQNLKVISIKKGAPPQIPKKTHIKEAITINFDAYNEGLVNLLLKSANTTIVNK